MIEDYYSAKKLGDEAVRYAIKNGKSPYLPVLDALDEVDNSLREEKLGLMELPLNRIIGNKELGRTNAFANNFMPILDGGSEFSVKWSNVYDYYKSEGYRDAIKVYEYMNNYYVQEGNKRVSVAKYALGEDILADVTRIVPKKTDTKECKVYYEYMDFYRVTKNYFIVLSEPGSYKKLASLLDQDLEHEWPEELKVDLKSAFFNFKKKCQSALRVSDDFTLGDAFLIYISIFPMKTLFEDTETQIKKNIRLMGNDLLVGANVDNIAFLDEAPVAEKQGRIKSFLNGVKRYTANSPLKVAFIYDADIEESRWIDSHEAGRLYVDEMTEDNVSTQNYICKADKSDFKDVLAKVVKDGNEIVFTVDEKMAEETLKEAIHYPNVKFLNCSVGNSYSSVRCYQGKLYEASFLAGVLTASRTLKKGLNRRIGYLVRGANMSRRNLNAFAIGVSMIDDECKICLKYSDNMSDEECRMAWIDEGVEVYADIEYASVAGELGRPGVYFIKPEKDEFLCTPYYSWGRFYVQIVQSVLSGSWDVNEIIGYTTAANYWFGLSAGVVDIRAPKISYQEKKLLGFLKNAMIHGDVDPFSGAIYSQNGLFQKDENFDKNIIPVKMTKMNAGRIAVMDWFNDNIEG